MRPRLRTVLLLIHLTVLALPLGGIAVLRIYESALIRQTESELIAQGVLIAASYRATFRRLADHQILPPSYGHPVTAMPAEAVPGRWRPRLATLDLAIDPVLPEPPEPAPTAVTADPIARDVGLALERILRDAQVITLAGLRVVDASGVVVASTAEDTGMSLAGREEVMRALTGEYVSLMRARGGDTPPPPLDSISRGTRLRVHVTVPIIIAERVLGAVVLNRTPANILQAVYGKRWALLKGGALLLAVVAALSLLLAATITRPLSRLVEQARRAARGEPGAFQTLEKPGTHEIAELSDTVAQMARALESRADYVRDLAAHISHEFKTPLTSMRGAVEILVDHGDSLGPAERERFYQMLDADTGYLQRLVGRILELARADMLRPGDEVTELSACLGALAARHPELELGPVPDPLAISMGQATLESILDSLLDNSTCHGGAAVRVRLEVQTPTNGRVQLRLSDDGRGISEANAARIFEPFFTTARDAGSTGMGLTIVAALLRAHGGSITNVPVERGASFEVELPLAASRGQA